MCLKKSLFFTKKSYFILQKKVTFFYKKKLLFFTKKSYFLLQKKVTFFCKKKYFSHPPAVRNTWNWRSSVGSEGCSALSRSKESFKRALLSKIIPRNPSSNSPSIWKVYWLMISWPKCAARFLISTTSASALRRGDFILLSNDFMVSLLLTNWFIGITASKGNSTGLETHAFWRISFTKNHNK